MASITDLTSVFTPAPPAGFTLADLALQGTQTQTQADVDQSRVLRNFSQFDLPDLLSSQAARGALHTSATGDKRFRLTTGAADQLGDIQLNNASVQAGLASNALLAQTGIQLNSGAR